MWKRPGMSWKTHVESSTVLLDWFGRFAELIRGHLYCGRWGLFYLNKANDLEHLVWFLWSQGVCSYRIVITSFIAIWWIAALSCLSLDFARFCLSVWQFRLLGQYRHDAQVTKTSQLPDSAQKSGFNDGAHSRHYLELGIGLESSVIYHLFRFSNMLIELL